MNFDLDKWWNLSLSKSTLSTYKSALSCFLSFLTLQSLVAPWLPGTLPHISEDNLLTYVIFCQESLHLRYDTIKLYLAGIRFHYIKHGLGDPVTSSLRLPYIMRAVKKSQCNLPVRNRLPITFPILQHLCVFLEKGMFTPFIDLMLLCAFKTAFYGFLRCGEFTCKSVNESCVKVKDVVVENDNSRFQLLLRSSKTDPYGCGVTVFIFENNLLSPVTTMIKYLNVRFQQGALADSPLFIENENNFQPLTRTKFLSYLKEALSRLGYDDQSFNGHSFRIGACTSGAAAGVEGHVLQMLGRWKSDCFTRYIRTHPSTIQKAQNAMNLEFTI